MPSVTPKRTKTLSPKFRGTQNRLHTNALFLERTIALGQTDRQEAVLFSLFEGEMINSSIKGIVSAKDTYIKLGDITGYKWAMAHLEGYHHFQKLMTFSWFKEHAEQWNNEIEAFIRMKALKAVMDIVGDDEAPEGVRLTAAKYVAEKGWERDHKKTNRAGRPSKSSVTKEAKKQAEQRTQEQEDAKRIGLKLVKG